MEAFSSQRAGKVRRGKNQYIHKGAPDNILQKGFRRGKKKSLLPKKKSDEKKSERGVSLSERKGVEKGGRLGGRMGGPPASELPFSP